MIRHARYFGSGRVLALTVAAALAAAVSSIPAGIGNLGRAGTNATGGTNIAASAEVNPPFSVNISVGQPVNTVRNNLVAAIAADANYAASSVTDTGDPNSASFSVTKAGGADVDHLKVCENDSNIDNVGVSFAMGRDLAVLNKVTAVGANGNYILIIGTWDHGTTSLTFDTTQPANNTPAGLNASIISGFTAAGFGVTDDGLNIYFRRPGDMITSLRVSSTDTGVVIFCVDLNKASNAAIPTAGEVGMFLLVLMLTGSAIWMLRRGSMARIARP